MNMNDIIRFLKIMWSPTGYSIDPYMIPIPFKENIFLSKKKLKIGYWKNGDGWFTTTQSVKRGISEVVNILQKEYEYELVELPFNDGFKVLTLYFKYMGSETNMKEYIRFTVKLSISIESNFLFFPYIWIVFIVLNQYEYFLVNLVQIQIQIVRVTPSEGIAF